MPVKVRCPSCDKVLSAPDAARGKAIKCPGCDTRIKVPEQAGSGGKKPTRAGVRADSRKEESSSHTLDEIANIDFSKVAESSSNMCPRCGADIPDEAPECPKCGVDPATGQLSEAARKRASRKGPDPALYYASLWKDCWQYTRDNMRIVRRTTVSGVFFGLVAAFCAFMVYWCGSGPPKAFWGMFLVVSCLVMPGWFWILTLNVIRVTVARKGDVTEQNFDIFENVSLGLKVIVWSTVFFLPVTFLMAPLAMIHMAMPVTKKAWLFPAMIPIFFRNLGPTMYWWLMYFAGSLALSAVSAGAGFVLVPTAARFAGAMQEGGGGLGSVGAMAWVMVSLLAVLAVVYVFLASFFAVYAARGIGLIAYYFKDNLDLVTLVAEQKYVKREIKLDKFGNPIKTREQKIKEGVLSFVVFLIVCAAGYFVYRTIVPSHSSEAPPAAPEAGNAAGP